MVQLRRMEPVGETVHVGCDVLGQAVQIRNLSGTSVRRLEHMFELLEPDGEQCQPLVEIIMKLSSNPTTLSS